MHVFACEKLGYDCDFEAVGETAAEVLEEARKHGLQAHAQDARRMAASMTDEEIRDRLMTAVDRY